MGLIALLFSMCAAIFAEEPQANYKWDWETAFVSRKWEKEGAPQGLVDAWWASPSYNYKSGFLQKDVPREYRHMHAMVIAAFYSKRADHRATAMDWLDTYSCENILACEKTKLFFETAYKANVLTLKGKNKEKLKNISQRIQTRTHELSATRPSPSLCGKDSPRDKWLELEYALSCPRGKAPPEEALCADCAASKRLELNIGMDSHQLVMSSSYLGSLVHSGSKDCSQPWQVVMTCGGTADVSYTYSCERTKTTFPQNIKCTLVKS